MLRENAVQETCPRGGRRRTGRSWFRFNAGQAQLFLLARIVWLNFPRVHWNHANYNVKFRSFLSYFRLNVNYVAFSIVIFFLDKFIRVKIEQSYLQLIADQS